MALVEQSVLVLVLSPLIDFITFDPIDPLAIQLAHRFIQLPITQRKWAEVWVLRCATDKHGYPDWGHTALAIKGRGHRCWPPFPRCNPLWPFCSCHSHWCGKVSESGWAQLTLACAVAAWKSKECPIESVDRRDTFLCTRPCDYEEPVAPSSDRDARKDDNFFIVFFPPKSGEYEKSRLKCPANYKQVNENNRCFCERPFTPYEIEVQKREKCDQAFEECRMYGSKPYDCNSIIEQCPATMIRDYCLAGKVYRMRFARVLYEFCHIYLRLPHDGKRHFLKPNIDRLWL